MNNSVRRKGFHHPLPTSHFDEIDYVHSSYSFPEKLYIILENEDIDCVRWAPNGICFRILNEEVFLKKIMPQFFKQSKMTSFQRQLNSYGFRKISRGVDVGCYFHPKFQKDRTDLLLEVQRLPAKGSLESYEEVQFSQRKELSFDYNRTTGIRKKVKKDEKPVLKTTYLPPSTAASSPVSSISSDDCSVSSLSSGDVEPPKPVTTLNRYKGPYLFLGCGKPASLMQTEQFQQYRLYEQHCMNRLAEFQQEQMQYSIFPGISPAFIPYPAHEPSPYAYDDSDYNFENFHEDVYWSYVNYSPLPAAIESGNISTYPLTFFAQSSPSPSHEKQPSMEDWADSLMNMPWTSTGSDECYLI